MEDNGDRQAYFDSINMCWGANDANEAAEEVEEVEEEEEAGSLFDQIIERRQGDDNWGITDYFNSKWVRFKFDYLLKLDLGPILKRWSLESALIIQCQLVNLAVEWFYTMTVNSRWDQFVNDLK